MRDSIWSITKRTGTLILLLSTATASCTRVAQQPLPLPTSVDGVGEYYSPEPTTPQLIPEETKIPASSPNSSDSSAEPLEESITYSAVPTSVEIVRCEELEGVILEKLSRRLQLFVAPDIRCSDPENQALALGLPSGGSGALIRNPASDLMLYIRLTHISDEVLNDLSSLTPDIVNISEDSHIVTAYIATESIELLSQKHYVTSLQEVISP